MNSVQPIAAECDDRHLTVTLADGRVLRAPLWWYPRLLAAPPARRAAIELSPLGVHWPDIDEDISVASILRGAKAQARRRLLLDNVERYLRANPLRNQPDPR